MERQDAYNLYHEKEKFVKLLEEKGFRYDERDSGFLRLSSPDECIVGRILPSNPPYLIIFNRAGDRMRKERSRLKNLAKSFSID